MRALKWILGILGGVLGLVTVALVAAFVVFQTGWGHRILRSQIESKMSDTFIGGAKVGAVTGNPLSELVLHDVVINGPDKQPAIVVKQLKVKLPLMPLISHQLRVDEVIADDLDIHVKGDNLSHLTRPGPKSTWSIALPNVEVHRGHVAIERPGEERVDLDSLELAVDARLPFAGPIDASGTLTGTWRQRKAPISVAGLVHVDQQEMTVPSAGVRVGDIDVAVLGARIPKGPFAKAFAGTVAVRAPAAEVHRLVPKLELPDDVALAVNAKPEGRLTYATITAVVGKGEVHGFARADVQAKLASGFLSAGDLDLGRLSRGKISGHGGATVAFDVDGTQHGELPKAHALVTAWSSMAGGTRAVIALDTAGEHARATIGATTGDGVRAGVGAVIRKRGKSIVLERGDVVASTQDVGRATRGKAPVHGVLRASFHASGALAPHPALAVSGEASGRRLEVKDLSADSLRMKIDARGLPSHPVGGGRVELYGLTRGDLELGKLTLAAGNRPDGKLQVSLRSQPKQAPWLIDLDALVTTGETTVVELQRHFVRAGGGAVWRGNTGTITIGPRTVELRGLRSTSGNDHLGLDGSYVRAGRGTGDFAAHLDAGLELANLGKLYKGRVDANVDVKRIGGRFTGAAFASAAGVALSPQSPVTLDGHVAVEARADKVAANIDLATAKAGSAKLAVDIDAPKNIADMRAWKKLDRQALRTVEVALDHIDLEPWTKLLGKPAVQGKVDGKIELTPDAANGNIAIRGVQVKQSQGIGGVDADLKITQEPANILRTTLAAKLIPIRAAVAANDVTKNGAARLTVDASFKAVDHLFDPGAWRKLGANAFHGATIRAERLAFQPGTLELLGVVSPLRGELAAGADIEEGLRAVRFQVNLHRLRGGLFAQPIGATVAGVLDDKSLRTLFDVRAQGITLVHAGSTIPVTLAELRENPKALKTAPISALAQIEQVPAVKLMNVIGTSQITGGTLDGTIKVAGIVAKPTVDAKLVARNVTVPSAGLHPIQMIDELTLAATWDGARGKVAVDGKESGGGTLAVRAEGAPTDLAAATASVRANRLDIAPLVAFMPGPAGGLGGRMDANLTMKGADPKTAELAGTLNLANGRIPIAPAVGTLFQGDVRIKVENRSVGLALTGKLGRGDIKVIASAPLQGFSPRNGKAQITIRKVQLIGTTEPIVSGVIDADIARVGEVWRSNVSIQSLTVKVPKEKGNKLSPAGKPPDLVYGGEKIHHGKNKGKDVPQGIVHEDTGPADLKPPTQVQGTPPARTLTEQPLLVAVIKIANVFVESEEVRGLVGGKLTVSIANDKQVGIVGNLGLSRGVLDLFNRRYQVDKAALHFDGSPDPRLDVRITHDFPEVTTITEVRGRMSKPELVLSSQPPQYSQAELLGFLLGGEPGGDPQNAPSATQRVEGAGASFLANQVGGYVKKALPVDIDVLRYESASSTSSAAVTVGTWLTDTLFLAYRQHLETRPDENSGEGEVEYWIQRRLVLEGVAGDRGVDGVDLLWRRRW